MRVCFCAACACVCVRPHLAQVVVEVHVPGAEVAPQQGGVRGEHRCHGDLAGAGEDEPGARLPLVEVSDDVGGVAKVIRQLQPMSSRPGRRGKVPLKIQLVIILL